MSKLHFLVPRELSGGLHLAGAVVTPLRDAGALRDALQEIVETGGVRAVIVPEHMLARLEGREIREWLSKEALCIIPLPMDWQATRDARKDLEERVQHILGFKIPISDQLTKRKRSPEEVAS